MWPSHQEACLNFQWSSILKDLGWQDRAHINLGDTIVDRYASLHGVALYWVGKDRSRVKVTYRDLRSLSNKVANLLRSLGVHKGDRVAGILPRVPETIAIMIGTWKAGAVYVPIFTGFGQEAIRFRLLNCEAKLAFTHHEYRSRLAQLSETTVVTIGGPRGIGLRQGDISFWQAIEGQHEDFDLEKCSRTDPAIILYGDLARRDPAGYFWFEGRADDVIKTSGYRVGPFEVESAILHHPAIAEAAVVGKPDPLKGHILKAFVTLRPGHSRSASLAREVQDIARRIVGDHAYPREVEVVDSLPKTESGKIQRFKLRAIT
jgi:acyl-coenzyme A synthetase/AMP-(fatty) acid ligase